MKIVKSLLLLAAIAAITVSAGENIRKRILPRPVILAQTQFKYPLNTLQSNYSYYSRWTDWPLFINRAPAGNKVFNSVLWDQDYVFIQKTMKQYGLDGSSAFLPSEKKILSWRRLWAEFAPLYPEGKLVPAWNPNTHVNAVRLALESPATLKINGKVPIVFYASYPEAKRKALSAQLKQLYPGKILLLHSDATYGNIFKSKFRNGTLNARDIEAIKVNLRKVLRDGDGFYFSRRPRDVQGNGVLYLKFYEYMVKLISEVMAEDEFKDKLLALTAGVEHSNSYNIGYSLVSDGTATLRGFMDIALKYNADIINIPEWDEQNENSSLRPTVFKGLSLMRLMRYYAARTGKLPAASLPGDNAEIPDMVVSFRKMLVLGEKFKIELLHIPDDLHRTPYEVLVTLKSADGRELHKFAPVKLGGNRLRSADLILPSEKFSSETVIYPEIMIRRKNMQWHSNSLGATILQAASVNDYEEFHIGVRDVINAKKSLFTTTELPDRQVAVNGKFVFNEAVRQLELLENGRCIYSYTAPGQNSWRDDREYAALEISLMSALHQVKCSGDITITSPEAQWKIAQVVNPGLRIRKNALFFKNINLSSWEARAVTSIPRSELPNCQVKVNIPGLCEKSFSFAELLKLENYAIYGKNGFILSFSRQNRQAVHPVNQDRKEFTVSTIITPEKTDSVLMFQAVTPDGRQFRSTPIALYPGKNAPQKNAVVYSDTLKQPIKLKLAEGRVPEINYIFTDKHGSTLPAAAGRHFWASRGGYTLHSTGKGGGATARYGIGNMPASRNYPANAVCGMPALIEENGQKMLYFDGIGNFITLPQGVITRRSGYTIEIKLCPDRDFSGNCMLIGSSTCRNTHAGLRIFLRNGKISTEFMNKNLKCTRHHTDIRIPNGQWSNLKITRDLKNLSFELNGKFAGSVPCSEPGIFDTLAIVGGSGNKADYFKGRISRLTITHHLKKAVSE